MQFVPSKRAGFYNLSISGFLFKKNKSTETSIYYVCTERNCSSRVVINIDKTRIIKPPEPHNHSCKFEHFERYALRERMIQAIIDEPTKNLHEVYQEEIEDSGNSENVPTFASFKTTLYRARQSAMPPIPETVQDIHFEGEWDRTKSRKRFLLHQDDSMVIFATRLFCEKLTLSEVIICDGTFRSAPRPFLQLYVIFGVFDGRKIPLVWSFLSDKSSYTYVTMFNVIKERCCSLGVAFSPSQILSDYESGFLKACQLVFPEAQKMGCYFHYTQSIYKRIQRLGLAYSYRFNEKLRLFVRRIFCLAYLPIGLVRINYTRLRESPKTARLIAKKPKLKQFLT